jgi:hypothetical protein
MLNRTTDWEVCGVLAMWDSVCLRGAAGLAMPLFDIAGSMRNLVTHGKSVSR